MQIIEDRWHKKAALGREPLKKLTRLYALLSGEFNQVKIQKSKFKNGLPP